MAAVLSAWCHEDNEGHLAPLPSQGTESKAQSPGFHTWVSHSLQLHPVLLERDRALSFLCEIGCFVSGKDILVFHFSGKEQRHFLCRVLSLDLFSPQTCSDYCSGQQTTLLKRVSWKAGITTSRRFWRNLTNMKKTQEKHWRENKSLAGQADTICHLPLKTFGLCRPEATRDNIIVSLEGNSVGYLGHTSSPL